MVDSKYYLRCNVNNSYHSWADPRRLFLVWKPELKINFEANCTVSMASSSASGLSFSLLTYGELAFMIFRMNWKYSCVYWFRWWRNLTFCFWIERSIGAGILIFLFELVPLSLPVDVKLYMINEWIIMYLCYSSMFWSYGYLWPLKQIMVKCFFTEKREIALTSFLHLFQSKR